MQACVWIEVWVVSMCLHWSVGCKHVCELESELQARVCIGVWVASLCMDRGVGYKHVYA